MTRWCVATFVGQFLLNFVFFIEMYRILWDNLPVDNIIKLFTDHKLFTDDDLDVISFAVSEYLKSQFLFRYLQNLKLSVWSMVCDVLHNTKSLRHIGSQLMNGKCSNT